jgi:hypothetical protein
MRTRGIKPQQQQQASAPIYPPQQWSEALYVLRWSKCRFRGCPVVAYYSCSYSFCSDCSRPV